MSISSAEKDWFERAREKFSENRQIEGLAKESTFDALAKAESSLASASAELRPGAEAQAALAIAFTYFAAGSSDAVQKAVAANVAAHVECCKAERVKLAQGLKSGSFLVESRKTLLNAPMWLTVYLSIVSVVGMIVFREQFIKYVFGG